MPETMIERVAKAICRENCEGISHPADRNSSGACKPYGCIIWRTHVESARAAIEAMREPTPEMVEVGQNPIYTSFGMLMDGFDQNSIVLFNEVWRAVLDTALNEK